jgi:hypothetical protein
MEESKTPVILRVKVASLSFRAGDVCYCSCNVIRLFSMVGTLHLSSFTAERGIVSVGTMPFHFDDFDFVRQETAVGFHEHTRWAGASCSERVCWVEECTVIYLRKHLFMNTDLTLWNCV